MMLRAFSWLAALLLLGGCYTQFKATKQVGKALANYPQIVAKIAQDSFPCNVIRIDTIITVKDSIVECIPIENFTTMVDTLPPTLYPTLSPKINKYGMVKVKTFYITRTVESTAKLVIIKASLDSSNNAICELQKAKDELTGKVTRKNKTIWWLIAFMIGLSMPYLIRIVRYITLY